MLLRTYIQEWIEGMFLQKEMAGMAVNSEELAQLAEQVQNMLLWFGIPHQEWEDLCNQMTSACLSNGRGGVPAFLLKCRRGGV